MRLSRFIPLAFAAITVAACAGSGSPGQPAAPGASAPAVASAAASSVSTPPPGASPTAAAEGSAVPTAETASVPPRDPPAYTTGTASIRLTGKNKGAETLELAADALPGGPAALPYASLIWLGKRSQSGTAQALFRLFTIAPHETGDLSAKGGTLGIEMVFTDATLGDIDPSNVTFQEGLGEEPNPFGDPTAPGPSCTATIAATPTGGISGTFTCPDISDSGQIVVGAEGEFTAEQ